MSLFIHGSGYILPKLEHDADLLTAGEPAYEQWIDIRQLRRMSRIIKMGVTSALMALKNSGIEKPDAIITGTGYGCLDDTGIFLTKVVDKNNQVLNPTPFIQSTHNTIGSQIALLLQCLGYNQTYSQDSFSFEHALLDALLLSRENPNQKILVGGIDEITAYSAAIHNRFKAHHTNTLGELETTKGQQKGEGAAYFVVAGEPSATSNEIIESVSTLYKPDQNEWEQWISDFLDGLELKSEDINLVLVGNPAQKRNDFTSLFTDKLFLKSAVVYFNHVCGEYPTVSAMALQTAVSILRKQQIPDFIIGRSGGKSFQNVLIYNQYFCTHHSLILVRLCHATQ